MIYPCPDAYRNGATTEAQMKDNQSVSVAVADAFDSVTFEVRGQGKLVLEMGKLHEDIIKRAACVGMAQVRIVDAAAVGKADKDGNIIPEAERNAMKFARMKALVDHYNSGTATWERVRVASAAKEDSIELIQRAIGRALQVEADAVGALLDNWAKKRLPDGGQMFKSRDEYVRFLGKSAKVREALALIKAEAIKPVVDADAELEALTAGE